MNDNEYVTKHHGLASFLLYQYPDAYISTEKIGEFTFIFRFSDPDKCIAAEVEFFDGTVVADARTLTDCTKVIRQTTTKARKSPDGIYRRDER